MTLANHGTTPIVGSAIIADAEDKHNGVELEFQTPAAGAQLPHNGAACWMSPVIRDIAGEEIFPFFPAVNPIEALILERRKSGTDPLLVRVGMLICNAPDPSSPACTEGWGLFLSFPSTNIRQVGMIRVSGAGTWGAPLEGTGRSDHFGARGSGQPFGLNGMRNCMVTATDANGVQATPNPANSATLAATTVTMTQARTDGVPVTWHTGIWAGWQAASGVAGVRVRFAPMYWARSRPGVG